MLEVVLILLVLQKLFSLGVLIWHLICVCSPVLEHLLQNRSQNHVRVMLFLLVLCLPVAVICRVPQALGFRNVLNQML